VRRSRIIACGAAGLAVGAGLLAGGGSGAPVTASASSDTATAPVERRDLVDRETAAGTLGYTDAGTINAGVAGTLTHLRAEGAVVRRGGWLYEVDGERTIWLI
jgi:hypothetical protein